MRIFKDEEMMTTVYFILAWIGGCAVGTIGGLWIFS